MNLDKDQESDLIAVINFQIMILARQSEEGTSVIPVFIKRRAIAQPKSLPGSLRKDASVNRYIKTIHRCRHCFRMRFREIVLILLLGLSGAGLSTAGAEEKVVLQLRWDHQFQFAGYYAALWKGYYQDAGLDVEILSGFTPDQTKIDVLAAVAEGRAHFGIGGADILTAQDQGLPLVILASIFQQSAVAFYALDTADFTSPVDFMRLRVGRKIGDTTDVEMQAMLRAEGINPEKVAAYPARFGVPDLLTGEVDVVADYTLSADWTAQKLGLHIVSIKPSSYGIDFYGDSLFTRKQLVDDNPDMVRRFTQASIKGWRYAMKHTHEMSDQIEWEYKRILPVEDFADFNRFQARKMQHLMHYPFVDPGHTNPDRWHEMLKHLYEARVVSRADVDMDQLIFNPARRKQAREEFLVKTAMIAGAVLCAVILVGFVWILLIRRQKEALRDAEEQSRLLLESAGEGIFGVDDAGCTIFINPAAVRMLGFTADELLGQRIHEHIHHSTADGTSYPAEQCPMSATYTEGVTHHVTREVLWRKNGHCFPVEYTSTPIKKGDRVAGAVVTFRDLTEMLALNRDFVSLLEHTSDFIYIKDRSHRFTAASQAYADLTGHAHWKDLSGKTDFDIFPREEAERNYTFEKAVIENGEIMEGHDLRYVNTKGRSGWMHCDIRPIYGQTGDILGLISISRDITEIKQKEDELRRARLVADRANQAKSDFLANMSHEIRTPMNAVIGMTYLAMQTDLTPKQMNYLKKINVSSHALLRIINDILDFSKIEAGKLDIEHVAFHLEDVMNNVADLISDKTRDKGLELLIAVSPDVPQVLVGDPLRLSQILINLLGNAVKFTQKGEIVVSVDTENKTADTATLRFEVRDTGMGMTPYQAEGLFQPFTQGDSSITRKYGGTGLGLAISKRLVGLMGGDIKIDSEVGKGSTFRFTVTFGLEEKSRIRRLLAVGDLRGMRVLVVDDSLTSRNILRDYLTAMTFEVSTADSGEAALVMLERAIAENRACPLVLMDWKMPGMDGIETACRIKRDIPPPHRPAVIMVTAYGREDIIAQANIDDLDGFLIKPTNPSVLFNTIMELFGKDVGHPSRRPAKPPIPADGLKRILGARILLVEDNDINRQVAVELLEQMGVSVDIAVNGKTALEALRAERYDLVLMDIQMPVMDGLEATRLIRASDRDVPLHETDAADQIDRPGPPAESGTSNGKGSPPSIPIVAMTAHAMSGDREKSLAAGMNDHITKPIDPEVLFSVLLKWIPPLKHGGPPGRSLSRIRPQGVFPNASSGVQQTIGPSMPSPDLEDMPGISVTNGLARVGGNKALYRNLLKKFYQENRTIAGQIKKALVSDDPESSRRALHSLKGVAGNIGAVGLYEAAGELESALSQTDPEVIAEGIRRFESALDTVLGSLRKLSSETDLAEKGRAEVGSPGAGRMETADLTHLEAAFDRNAAPSSKRKTHTA